MNEKYDLESILEEIRRKKQAQTDEENTSVPQEGGSLNAEDETPADTDAVSEKSCDNVAEAPKLVTTGESAKEKDSSYEEKNGGKVEAEEHIAGGFVFNDDSVNDGDEKISEENNEKENFDFDVDAAIKKMNGKADSGLQDEEKTAEPKEDKEVIEETRPETDNAKDSEDINEYRKPDDAPAILEELHQLKSSLTLRLVLTIIIFAATLYMAASTILPLPMPNAISLLEAPIMFVGANIVLTAAAVLINNAAVGGGLISLAKFKANNDSLVAFAALAAIAHGAAMTASPEWLNTTAVNIYFPMAVLGIMFNIVGKMMFADRISANFKIVSASYQKYAACKVNEEECGAFVNGGSGEKHDIAYFAGTDFLSDFLKTAYDETYVEKSSRILAPVVIAASFVIGIAGFLITKDIFAGISAFAATACIAAPLTSTLIGNIPMGRAARNLCQRGTCIAGYDAITEFSETDTILLRADDIFPQGTIQMHGMKPFGSERIEDAVADAASVANAVDSPLKHIFMPVMNKYGNTSVMDVDAFEIYNGEGIVADIRGREVIMGTRSMMNRYGIFLPSEEQEKKLLRDGREIIYISSDGKLSAVFVISYHADDEIAETLLNVQESGINIVVQSNDPFISEDKIAGMFDLNSENIAFMDEKSSETFAEISSQQEKSKCLIASTASPMMLVRAILSADRVRSAISVGAMLQIISMLMGVGIVAFFALTGSIVYLGCVPVLSYQLAWSLVIAVMNAIRKY